MAEVHNRTRYNDPSKRPATRGAGGGPRGLFLQPPGSA